MIVKLKCVDNSDCNADVTEGFVYDSYLSNDCVTFQLLDNNNIPYIGKLNNKNYGEKWEVVEDDC